MNQLLPKDLLVYARKFDEYEINKSIRSTVKAAKKHKRWFGAKPEAETPNRIVLGRFNPHTSLSVYTDDFDMNPIHVIGNDSIEYSALPGSHLNISMHNATSATPGRKMIIDGQWAIVNSSSTHTSLRGYKTGTIKYTFI